jgi:UDP-glucose 4-epimerase
MEERAGTGKRVIVTGGAGFIGTHLTRTLVERGYEVHVVDTLVGTLQRDVEPPAILHIVDIRDRDKLDALFGSLAPIHGVFHAAALPSVPYSIENPRESNDVNVNGTLAVLDEAKKHGVRRLIFSSSCAVYGDPAVIPSHEGVSAMPLSPYALQKQVGEQYCKLYSLIYELPTVVLRYFNVYGPGADPYGPYASAIGRFIELRRKSEPLTIIGDGEQTRDMVHVHDVAHANVLALEKEGLGHGEVINIGSGEKITVNEMAKHVGGEKVYLPPRQEPRHSCADNALAKKLLGWEPTISVLKGVEELKRAANLA